MKRSLQCVAIALVAASAATAPAQPVQNVVEIQVVGNKQMSTPAVLGYLQTRVGAPYEEKVLRADEQRLLKTGRFLSVSAAPTKTDQGVSIVFTVAERPLIAAVAIRGNTSIKTSKLEAGLPFGASDPLNEYSITTGREAIKGLYKEKGYHFVDVTVDREELKTSRTVVYTVVEGPKVAVKKVLFEGNTHYHSLTLLLKIGSKRRIWPFMAGKLDVEQVERDVDTLRNLYTSEGFLDAKVARRLAFTDDKSRVVITFGIEEGPRYTVNRVAFRGNTVFTDDKLAERLGLTAGEHFTLLGQERDVKKIKDTYGELGYIEARVVPRKVFKEQPGVLDLVYEITESDQYYVGRIDIQGNPVTDVRVIRRELRFYPEQIYNTVAVEESRRRLLETRLFDSVTITPTGKEPGVRNALVQLREGRTAEFLVGFGISSSSGLLGNIRFTQRNFDILGWPKSFSDLFSKRTFRGAGQTLSIVAEPGTELMRFHINWFEPYLFDKPYSLGAKLFYFTRGRETYDESRYGTILSLGHRFPNRWYGELAARIEGVNINNLDWDAPPEVTAVDGTHVMLGLRPTLVRDRTDSRWMPSRGDRIRFSLEQVAGDFDFTSLSGDYRFYRTLWMDALDRKHVLATRIAAGHIFGDAPVFEKYYGGGLSSVRGFDYRGISPRSAGTDEPIGGDFMFFLGTEYRFPIIGQGGKGKLQGVVFLDSGTVESEFDITTYRVSAGFGIRWFIPMFGPVPISLDFGFPLNKDDEDDTEILSFSFGWRF